MKKMSLFSASVTLLAISFQTAFAATATTTFNVTAAIQSNCTTVTATTLAFGNYDPFAATATDQTNAIQVTCTSGTPYTIALNAGTTIGSTIANRLLANGASTLAYNIFTTAARSTVWGDGTNSSVTIPGTGNGAAQSYTGYGRIPLGQTTKPTGSYGDTIQVTVTY